MPSKAATGRGASRFVDREAELRELNALLARDGPQLLVVFGRRRIGKTSLLTRWLESVPRPAGIYWVAHRTSSELLLRSFSSAVAQALPGERTGFVFAGWEEGLKQLFLLARERHQIVVLDEFPYLVQSAPEIPSLLQTLWDRHARESKLVLVLCGSHYHMMQDQLLSARQPLFGRATASMLVEELGPADLGLFLPRYGPDQCVETYSVVGGVPKYLELWNDRAPVLRNIRQLVLSPATLFRHEAIFLIQDEIAEPRTYLALLEALGAGAKTPAVLARQAGITLAHVGKYLSVLVGLRLVRRVLSADIRNPRESRISRYEIRDPFLRFYFQFMYRHPDLVEQGRLERLASIIERSFESHVGSTAYEELARRHVARMGDQDQLPFRPEHVGRAWDRDAEIDVVAVDWESRSALVGECRWRRTKLGPHDLEELRARAEKLRRLSGFRKHLALFSRAGFTRDLVAQAARDHVLLFQGGAFEPVAL